MPAPPPGGAGTGSRGNAKPTTAPTEASTTERINSQWERETPTTAPTIEPTVVLIPNGNAKLEHIVFVNLLYHDMRILSMRNLITAPKLSQSHG